MGDFRVVLESMGGHGCNRNAKEGEEFFGCGAENCPDCIFARFVSAMKRAGMPVYRAEFQHWPNMPEHVMHDDRCVRCGYDPQDPKLLCTPDCRASALSVTDDYSERGVKYPSGMFNRATGRRVKNRF